MLMVEVFKLVDIIFDLYMCVVIYVWLGEMFVCRKDFFYKEVFLKVFDVLNDINDFEFLFRVILVIGYYMGKVGIKVYYKVFLRVVEDFFVLFFLVRDEILVFVVRYLVSFGNFGQVVIFVMEILDKKFVQVIFFFIVWVGSRLIQDSFLKVVYKFRKIKLVFEYIIDELYCLKVLIELVKVFIVVGSYERVLVMIREIEFLDWVKVVFKEFIFSLGRMGVIDKFISGFFELVDDFSLCFGVDFVVEFVEVFLFVGKLDIVVGMFCNFDDLVQVIFEVVFEVLDKNFVVILGFFEVFFDDEVCIVGKLLMDKIFEYLIKVFEEVVKVVVRRVRLEVMWVKVVRYYILLGDVEMVRNIGVVFQNFKFCLIVFVDVVRSYLKQNKIEEVIDVVFEVRDRKFVFLLMLEILVRVLSVGGI